MAITAVVLDVGGVLFVWDPVLVRAAMASVGVHLADFDPEVAHYTASRGLVGRKPVADRSERYSEAYLAALGIAEADRSRCLSALATVVGDAGWSTCSHVVTGTREGLAEIVSAGLQVAIVSNSDGTVAEHLATAGLCQLGAGPGVPLTGLIDSTVVGVAKPDAAIFQLALRALGVAPPAAVYVGDQVATDIDGARGAGMHAVHFDPLGFCQDSDHPHIGSLLELLPLVKAIDAA